VTKSVLISNLGARLHTGELRIHRGAIRGQGPTGRNKDFRRQVSDAGRATYAARTGSHDDLVLAVAIALWWAMSRSYMISEELRV